MKHSTNLQRSTSRDPSVIAELLVKFSKNRNHSQRSNLSVIFHHPTETVLFGDPLNQTGNS